MDGESVCERRRREVAHSARFHESSFDLRMKRQVAYCGDAILQNHSLARGEQLDERRQDAGLVSAQLDVCEKMSRGIWRAKKKEPTSVVCDQVAKQAARVFLRRDERAEQHLAERH